MCELATRRGCSMMEFEDMPNSKFNLLIAYGHIQPSGPKRDDWHHARTQAVLANGMNNIMYAFGRTRQRKTYDVSDFMMKQKKSNAEKIRALDAAFSVIAARSNSDV